MKSKTVRQVTEGQFLDRSNTFSREELIAYASESESRSIQEVEDSNGRPLYLSIWQTDKVYNLRFKYEGRGKGRYRLHGQPLNGNKIS